MIPVTFRPAAPGDFAALSRLILGENAVPHRRCIHSDVGSTPVEHAAELRRLHEGGGLLVLLAERDEDLLGVAACEIDPASGRGWMRGPHVRASEPLWSQIGGALVRGILDRLPASIHRLDSFLDDAHDEGNALYASLGFRRVRRVHVYTVRRPASDPPGEPGLPLGPEHAASCAALHDALFPATYVTGRQLCDRISPAHGVFVIAEGPQVLGYVAAHVETKGEGIVEFVGVAPHARGRGLGRRLLGNALWWLFVDEGVGEAALTVDDENANARALYDAAGFRLEHSGVNMRWES
jgi:GNAT superfamily N-acetyltransferase